MLPRLNSSSAEPQPKAGIELTAQLSRPSEVLPGDHGERFGEELERATARSTGDQAEGRRGQRRTEQDSLEAREGRTQATEARQARRDQAARAEDPSTPSAEDSPPALQPTVDTPRPRSDSRGTADRRSSSSDPGTPEGRPAGSQARDEAATAPPAGAPLNAPVQPGAVLGASGAPGSGGPSGPAAVGAAAPAAGARPVPAAGSAGPSAPGSAPATEPRAETGSKAPQAAGDVLGELLTQREEALERDAAILRQLRAQLAPGQREIALQLNPAELGRMHLRMALRGGRLTAHLTAESPEALAAIERQLPELGASLEAQGFEVQAFELELAESGLADAGTGGSSDPGRATPAPAQPGLLPAQLAAELDPGRGRTDHPTHPTRGSAEGALDLLV